MKLPVKAYLFTIVFIVSSFLIQGQADLELQIESRILETKRKVKLHLPASYNDSISKMYPLIVTLDAEHTYYFTVGNTEIMYDPDPEFEIIPETIVVGIYQNYATDGTTYNYVRGKDSNWNKETGKFSNSSQKFNAFVETELLPFLKTNYRIGNFKAILGHSLTASFVSSMLVENDSLFNAYVLLSPNLLDFDKNLFNSLKSRPKKTLIYLCTSEYDLKDHVSSIKRFDKTYSSMSTSGDVVYKFDNFNGENHMSLINRAIPSAIDHIFKLYNPINTLQVDDFLMIENKADVIKNMYQVSNEIYGTERKIRDGDLYDLADAAITNKNWKALKEIADLNIELYPDTETGYYSRARYEENYNKDLKAALKYFKMGYQKLDKDVFNKEDWYKEITRIEKQLQKNKN